MLCVSGVGGGVRKDGAGDEVGTVGSRARLPQFLLCQWGGWVAAATAPRFPGFW